MVHPAFHLPELFSVGVPFGRDPLELLPEVLDSLYGSFPHLFALPDRLLQRGVCGLVRVAGGDLVQVLETMLDLHDLALVAEVFLVADEDAVGVIALVVCLWKVRVIE